MASIRYAKTFDGAHIAFSVVGDGPIDLVYTGGYTISIDSHDEEPHVAHVWRRLASFSRLIRFDLRGIGLSDPIDASHPQTIEGMVADLLAVVEAAGASRVCVLGDSGACGSAIEFAVRHPDRIHSLVLLNGAARYERGDDYPYGHESALIEAFLAQNFDPDEQWSLDDVDDLGLIVPSLADDVRFRDWWTRASHRGASPATARAILACNVRVDLRDRLAHVESPTLVLHAAESVFVPVELGRYLSQHIGGATYAEVATADCAMWGLAADAYVDHIEEFVTGHRTSSAERVLTTVLFSDIVESTGHAVALGDRAWRALLDAHDSLVRAELTRYGGREINTTGDGFIAAFDSPTQAVACGQAVVDAAEEARIPVRVGIHTGECERRGDDLAGLAVHIAARVSAIAAPNEVLVSRTVRDLVGGSSLHFADRGAHDLKGIPDAWQLFALQR